MSALGSVQIDLAPTFQQAAPALSVLPSPAPGNYGWIIAAALGVVAWRGALAAGLASPAAIGAGAIAGAAGGLVLRKPKLIQFSPAGFLSRRFPPIAAGLVLQRPISARDMISLAATATMGSATPLLPASAELVASLLRELDAGTISQNDVRRRALSVIWQSLSHGFEGDHEAPASDVLLGLVEVAVTYMTSATLSPWGAEPRNRATQVLRYVQACLSEPVCNWEYDGHSMWKLYETRKAPIPGVYADQNCDAYKTKWRSLFRKVIEGWSSDRKVALPTVAGAGPLWLRFPPSLAQLGTPSDAEALIAACGDWLRVVLVDKRIIWPGGPASKPSIDIGAVFGILATALAGAAAIAATAGAAAPGVAAALAAATAAGAGAYEAAEAAAAAAEPGATDVDDYEAAMAAYEQLSQML